MKADNLWWHETILLIFWSNEKNLQILNGNALQFISPYYLRCFTNYESIRYISVASFVARIIDYDYYVRLTNPAIRFQRCWLYHQFNIYNSSFVFDLGIKLSMINEYIIQCWFN